MAFDFPNSPSEGTTYTPVGGPQWVYTGGVWKMLNAAQVGTAEARNRIVNGAMQISQEFGLSAVGNGQYAVDQFVLAASIATVGASKNPTVGPEGLASLSTWLSTAKPSLAAGDTWELIQSIEGTRISDFRWGTANAKQVVARFWAMCNVAASFTFRIYNPAAARFFLAPFTLVAGVWKEVVIVVPGDTTGVWPTDTGQGLVINCGLAAGSTYNTGVAGWSGSNMVQMTGQTNLAAVSTNIFYLANVGLYLDPNATGVPPPWQMPDEAQELVTCQRYYEQSGWVSWVMPFASATQQEPCTVFFRARKRTEPSITFSIASGNVTHLISHTDTEVVSGVGVQGQVNTFSTIANARM